MVAVMGQHHSDPLFNLDQFVIVIAGAAGGLGAPLAHALAGRGARIVAADIDKQRSQKLADALAREGAEAAASELDVLSSVSCGAVIDLALEKWGRVDGALNASGIFRGAPAIKLPDHDWEQTIDINLTGAFRFARAAGRAMVEQKRGSIVTIASVSSAVANPEYAAYAASKAGVAHFTRVLAVEWAADGVRVNAVGPAVIPTPLASPIVNQLDRRSTALSRIPMGRFGTPADLFGAIIFLLSPAASFVTGQILYVDGGRTLS
jgi:NAD(P)-dependent dehydrogenase (short-subunit alcohol dehydrogenase family)